MVGRPGRLLSPAPLRTRRANFPHRAPTEAIYVERLVRHCGVRLWESVDGTRPFRLDISTCICFVGFVVARLYAIDESHIDASTSTEAYIDVKRNTGRNLST